MKIIIKTLAYFYINVLKLMGKVDSMNYDVIIIGAGPAGLFSAYELINKNKKLKIAIVDRGFRVKKRVCPMNKSGIPCKNCNPCAILSGYGGAGTFSDGKLNFIPKLGKSDLTKYMSESEAYKLIDETELIFNKFHMDADISPSNLDSSLCFFQSSISHDVLCI